MVALLELVVFVLVDSIGTSLSYISGILVETNFRRIGSIMDNVRICCLEELGELVVFEKLVFCINSRIGIW